MKSTHKQRVRKYLEDFGSITSWEAIQEFGNTRLSATIFQLKDDGLDIESIMENKLNRYDEKTCFARYKLHPKVNKEVLPIINLTDSGFL